MDLSANLWLKEEECNQQKEICSRDWTGTKSAESGLLFPQDFLDNEGSSCSGLKIGYSPRANRHYNELINNVFNIGGAERVQGFKKVCSCWSAPHAAARTSYAHEASNHMERRHNVTFV